ncbi:hypothetical protein IU433_00565 [Nocardia puris]|uniref:hypothetical protein n=1 Tax=Nocardia puris TaxID=208602 RepID=UPI001893B8D3|nr:hypothetical protein [Nocardia puris]MBF6210276.1 hypothetical protein [Nocardia puris]MBF6367352.1 hypothetical protein [Nocardia puris]MBF6457537.1 hypothetical protein [Nocardia puris]
MTRPDPDGANPGQRQPNPFDTGLPMLRLPAPPAGKRRKRKSGRSAPRVRTPEQAGPVDPAVPKPLKRPSRRPDAEWAEWLDPPARPAEPPKAPPQRRRVPEDDPVADDQPEQRPLPSVPGIVDRTGGNPGPALRRPRPEGAQQQHGNKVLAVLILVGLFIAVGSILWAVLPDASPRKATPLTVPTDGPAGQPTSEPPTDPPSPLATPGCQERRGGDVVSGTGAGGTQDGPSAILAFERAYYEARSGAAARAVVAPDAAVPPADQIQRGIDQVPVGTRYCVQITRTATGAGDGQSHWVVRLTQQYPGEEARTFGQIITTRTELGRTLITGISMA